MGLAALSWLRRIVGAILLLDGLLITRVALRCLPGSFSFSMGGALNASLPLLSLTLILGGAGLVLGGRWWAYALVYVASVVNFVPGLFLMPFIGGIIIHTMPVEKAYWLLLVVNGGLCCS